VVTGKVGGSNAEAFGRPMRELPKPLLAYCRAGTRSSQLWNRWQAE
jgi:sulfide:quinone oxidoreductase